MSLRSWFSVGLCGLCLACLACADAAPPPIVRHGTFTADPPGQEGYVCYSLDVDGIDEVHVNRVTWHPPSGSVLLHHASLFAAAGLPPVGEVSCDPMPTRVAPLGVYTPGIEPLALPEGVAIELPAGTRRLLVLAHALRIGDGAASPTSVDLQLAPEPVEHSVNWVDVFGPVPLLLPQQTGETVGTCRFDQPVHIVSDWAHMHALGIDFHGVVVRKDGTRQALLDIPHWNFNYQLIYPIDVQLAAGDSVETQCRWFNSTDAIVTAGPYTANEMCNQGLLVWPFDHALCGGT